MDDHPVPDLLQQCQLCAWRVICRQTAYGQLRLSGHGMGFSPWQLRVPDPPRPWIASHCGRHRRRLPFSSKALEVGRRGVPLDVFDLDRSVIGDYQRLARSFTHIRAADLRSRRLPFSSKALEVGRRGVPLDVFDLDRSVIGDYQRFARSFTHIRAADLRDQIAALYASGRFWPEPLVSINPRYEQGPRIDELGAMGTLDARTAEVFRATGEPITLHRHQAQAEIGRASCKERL